MIHRICEVLGITTPIVLASEYGLTATEDPVERLANLLEKTGATEFLTAAGSSSYLNQGDLPMPIRFHEYEPQPYPEHFVPYMSVVDCLARHGPDKTLDLVRAGRREKAPHF
jgi:hypothetical protein